MDNYRYDMLLTHTLAHYLHDGHPYSWDIRSHFAIKELRPRQERHTIQIDDVNALYRIRARLWRECWGHASARNETVPVAKTAGGRRLVPEVVAQEVARALATPR